MINRWAEFFKVVLIFSISPGFVGAPYLIWGFYLAEGGEENFYTYLYLPVVVLYGFVGGMVLFGFPAFILGLIYASMRMRKVWMSYLFVSIFSPIFVFFFNEVSEYIFFRKAAVDEELFSDLICPVISLASVVAAHLSFRKE